jgi:hypothetical protein
VFSVAIKVALFLKHRPVLGVVVLVLGSFFLAKIGGGTGHGVWDGPIHF